MSNERVSYRALQFACAIFPLLAGIDKFAHKLVNWDQYVSPFAYQFLGKSAHPLLLVMGAFEISMGIGMLVRPRLFGVILSIYLLMVVANLVSGGTFYDIALRDFSIALTSFALSRMSPPQKAASIPSLSSTSPA